MSFFHSHKDHPATHKHSSPDHQHGPLHDSSHSPLAHHHNHAASPTHHPSLHERDVTHVGTPEPTTHDRMTTSNPTGSADQGLTGHGAGAHNKSTSTSNPLMTSTSSNRTGEPIPTYTSTDPTTSSSAKPTSKLTGDLKGMAQGVTGSIQAAVGTTLGQKGMAEKGFEKMSEEDARLAAKSGKTPVGTEQRSTTVGAEERGGEAQHGRGL
ncbi:hypothetical protein H2200_005129 [Cladophialophora chaetospira]|uniref:Uncharacterized protein n=1 Tax=Cladophialophora chaetospira TaxID=386627 RepID=A0AA39CJA7_9EURO|nr:hypothetical protein H2200_005129 [Cladophialophora chaetospira]